jgi:hypothetical protein
MMGMSQGAPEALPHSRSTSSCLRAMLSKTLKILNPGNSAARQIAAFGRSNDLNAVVDQLIRETEEGVVG